MPIFYLTVFASFGYCLLSKNSLIASWIGDLLPLADGFSVCVEDQFHVGRVAEGIKGAFADNPFWPFYVSKVTKYIFRQNIREIGVANLKQL